jgi:UPF0755 protein
VLLAIAFGWYGLALQPVGQGEAKTVTIDSGQGVEEIAAKLEEAGVIRNQHAFALYVSINNLRRNLKAGVYSLDPKQSTREIATKLSKGDVIKKRVTIPEGSTMAQIKQIVAKQGMNAAAFEVALKQPHANTFLASKPSNVDLEGYLFPDTYTLDPSTTPAQLVDLMLTAFGTKVTPDYDAGFKARGLTLHEGLTLASIIEKEVANEADRPMVAQVFYKRLTSGQALESDVTIDYGASLVGKTFDLSLDSLYNTYKHRGLPPGPICNPGLSALKAALNPAATDYVYFLAGKDGKTYFAHTFAEHEANIAKHLR